MSGCYLARLAGKRLHGLRGPPIRGITAGQRSPRPAACRLPCYRGMADLKLGDEVHSAGDPECAMCLDEYPEPCDCGGLIHGAPQDDGENEVIVVTRCDSCGRSEEDLETDVA